MAFHHAEPQHLLQLHRAEHGTDQALFKEQWESLVGLRGELLYLGGNEKETHKYVSELMGKETKAETDNPHLPMLNANWGCPKQERQPKEVKIRLWL